MVSKVIRDASMSVHDIVIVVTAILYSCITCIVAAIAFSRT